MELKTEEELVTKKTGQQVTQENRSQTTGAELVTEEEENAHITQGPIKTTTDQEVVKENPRETTDEPGKAQKRTDSESGANGNEEDSTKLPKEQKSEKQTEEADVEIIPRGVSSPQEAEEQGEKLEKESEQASKSFYELKAALTAMWLPAVVGDKRNLFIAASISTLITKILMLLVSVVLTYFFQENIHPHPFIFWSRVGKSPDS